MPCWRSPRSPWAWTRTASCTRRPPRMPTWSPSPAPTSTRARWRSPASTRTTRCAAPWTSASRWSTCSRRCAPPCATTAASVRSWWATTPRSISVSSMPRCAVPATSATRSTPSAASIPPPWTASPTARPCWARRCRPPVARSTPARRTRRSTMPNPPPCCSATSSTAGASWKCSSASGWARTSAERSCAGPVIRLQHSSHFIATRHRCNGGHRAPPRAPQGANVLTSSRSMSRLGALAVFIAASLGAVSVQATDITGAGSSFVYPVISKWSASYAEKTGNRVNYQSIGSGGGIAQIKAGTVDFGASDMPLDEATLTKFGLGQFPDVIGGIVPAFNVAGVAPGKLVLDGSTLAGIFLGSIAKWNDPAIAALNPGVKLPDSKITVVHRSDGSGTSFNFTNYLSKVSADWKAKVGEGTAVNWPTGIGGKGNEGVSAYIRQIPNSIGYVEYAYALKNH